MADNKNILGPLRALNSSGCYTQADPKFGVEEEWAGTVVNEETGETVARVYAPDSDGAIRLAKFFAAAPNMLAALKNIENDGQQVPAHAWGLIQNAIAIAEGGGM